MRASNAEPKIRLLNAAFRSRTGRDFLLGAVGRPDAITLLHENILKGSKLEKQGKHEQPRLRTEPSSDHVDGQWQVTATWSLRLGAGMLSERELAFLHNILALRGEPS